jgi:hypothetical protein
MFHGIERLVEGVQFRDAEAILNLSQNAVGGGYSLDQSVCLSRSRVGRAGFDGTPQIVDDLQQLAGKVRDRVLLRVLLVPFPLAWYSRTRPAPASAARAGRHFRMRDRCPWFRPSLTGRRRCPWC